MQGLGDRVTDSDTPEREVARGYRFGKLHNIGFDSPVVQREKLAGTPEAGNDFVRNQQDVVFVADFTNSWEVVIGCLLYTSDAADE